MDYIEQEPIVPAIETKTTIKAEPIISLSNALFRSITGTGKIEGKIINTLECINQAEQDCTGTATLELEPNFVEAAAIAKELLFYDGEYVILEFNKKSIKPEDLMDCIHLDVSPEQVKTVYSTGFTGYDVKVTATDITHNDANKVQEQSCARVKTEIAKKMMF